MSRKSRLKKQMNEYRATTADILAKIEALQTEASIHSLIGKERDQFIKRGARLWLIAEMAAKLQQIPEDDPDRRTLHGSGDAIYALSQNVGTIDVYREQFIASMSAAQRVIKRCSPWALIVAALDVEKMYRRQPGKKPAHVFGAQIEEAA